jgi:hypothetical protein
MVFSVNGALSMLSSSAPASVNRASTYSSSGQAVCVLNARSSAFFRTLPASGDSLPIGSATLMEPHGLYRERTSGEWLRTFAIITTDANELVAEIHDRMPLILAPQITFAGLATNPIRTN